MSFAGPSAEERETLETGASVPDPPLRRWQMLYFVAIVSMLLLAAITTLLLRK